MRCRKLYSFDLLAVFVDKHDALGFFAQVSLLERLVAVCLEVDDNALSLAASSKF